MGMWDMQNALDAKQAGRKLGREGLSEASIKAISDFDGSYKGAMVLAGKMKAIAQAAKFDSYWSEKVEDGYMKMLLELRNQRVTIEAKSAEKVAEAKPASLTPCRPKAKIGRPKTDFDKAEYNRQFMRDLRTIKRLGLEMTVKQYRESSK